MAEEETVGDVLSRTGKLNKPEMTTEVESYGLEVDPDWTKEEIMEHFEEFLLAPEESAPEEPPVEEPTPDEPIATVEGAPSPQPLPEQGGDAYIPTPPPPPSVANTTSPVRIPVSPGWGTTPGAKAP